MQFFLSPWTYDLLMLQVTPEEAARRCLRRERNKVAAAKCRQRRVDHTNRLLQVLEILQFISTENFESII